MHRFNLCLKKKIKKTLRPQTNLLWFSYYRFSHMLPNWCINMQILYLSFICSRNVPTIWSLIWFTGVSLCWPFEDFARPSSNFVLSREISLRRSDITDLYWLTWKDTFKTFLSTLCDIPLALRNVQIISLFT